MFAALRNFFFHGEKQRQFRGNNYITQWPSRTPYFLKCSINKLMIHIEVTKTIQQQQQNDLIFFAWAEDLVIFKWQLFIIAFNAL